MGLTLLTFLPETYGDEVLFRRIEEYRDKWHAEITHYVEIKEDVEHLQSDVEGMKLILKDIEKGIFSRNIYTFCKMRHYL